MTARPALQAQQSGGSDTSADPIRLLIVDDSSVARAVLTRMVQSHRDLKVVATASSAGEALDALKSVPVDIVLLDIEMPTGNGIAALPDIIAAGQGARVLVVSTGADAGAESTVKALAAGATDTLPKPIAGMFGGRFSEVLAERVRRIGRASASGQETEAAPTGAPVIQLRETTNCVPTCLAIGASTGGLHALNEFFASFTKPSGIPILVTQHLPTLFMPHFARQIAAASGREARVVQDGDLLVPDRIHVAPGTAHLCVVKRGGDVRIKLDTRRAASGCLPSVDPMLASVAEVYGRGGLGVVLSGMGRDGLTGSRALAAAGGVIMAQDQFSSAIWGMPRAVAEAGIASAVLPPRDLARRVAKRLGDGAWK
ncbi:MAG TPA: chemotaxis-specific protein-glutamate methyltransferase CheB [Allosphingosinicella sp.]